MRSIQWAVPGAPLLAGLLLSVVIFESLASGQTFTISTVAGTGHAGFSGDGGAAISAELQNPSGVAVAADGSLYIADLRNGRIRKVDPQGTISTIAGKGAGLTSGDGGVALAAHLGSAYGVAIDTEANVYVGDRLAGTIRKIGRDNVIVRFAGTGKPGFSGDDGPATDAQLKGPNDIVIDARGNVFIADSGNHRVRAVDSAGKITTVAGREKGYSGDGGPASSAELNSPAALCFDAQGSLYVCDFGNHAVRKIAPDGTISTIAGTGKPGFARDGGAAIEAQLFQPCGVAIDKLGQVFVADSANNRIRVVRTDGTIDTVAGTGKMGYEGDGGAARSALIAVPDLIDIDSAGNIYIAEFRNHVIRKLTPGR
jgi:sugar lactone lactonase YvrE